MSNHYFVAYECRSAGTSNWQRSNVALSIHPIEWLKDVIENVDSSCRILFYTEITEMHYRMIKDWIN
jgi:hypothetical protein